MRRPLLLLVLALAGCGRAEPTLHERHLAAAAEFDRANARATRLPAEPTFNQTMCLAYFMLHGDLPSERELMILRELITTRRSFPGDHCLAHIRNSLPAVIARRKHFERVELLRRQANDAHDAWLASTRRK